LRLLRFFPISPSHLMIALRLGPHPHTERWFDFCATTTQDEVMPVTWRCEVGHVVAAFRRSLFAFRMRLHIRGILPMKVIPPRASRSPTLSSRPRASARAEGPAVPCRKWVSLTPISLFKISNLRRISVQSIESNRLIAKYWIQRAYARQFFLFPADGWWRLLRKNRVSRPCRLPTIPVFQRAFQAHTLSAACERGSA